MRTRNTGIGPVPSQSISGLSRKARAQDAFERLAGLSSRRIGRLALSAGRSQLRSAARPHRRDVPYHTRAVELRQRCHGPPSGWWAAMRVRTEVGCEWPIVHAARANAESLTMWSEWCVEASGQIWGFGDEERRLLLRQASRRPLANSRKQRPCKDIHR